MKVRKLLAGILSAAMVLGTMVVPVSAATEHYYNVLPTETSNVLTMGGEEESDCIYEFNTDTEIDLTGKTLKMTGKDVCISVYSNVTITGGTIDVNVTGASDGIFRIGYFGDDSFSLTLKNVTINLNNTKSAAGVFYLWNANNSLTLENCTVTGTNLDVSGGVFYTPDQNGNRGKVSISGGSVNVTNSKGLFFSTDVDIDDVDITSSTGKPAFRFAEGTVSGSTLDVTITSIKGDAAVDSGNRNGSVVRFVDTEITAAEGTTFATADSVTTDAKSTLNEAPLSEVENVTLKIADKLPEAVNGVITLTEDVQLVNLNPIKGIIDLNGNTLTFTGTTEIENQVTADATIKNGNIEIKDYQTADAVFYLRTANTTLTLEDVKVTADKVKVATGIFAVYAQNAKLVLKNTDITTSNLIDTYVFFGDSVSGTSVEVNGGNIVMKNTCTEAGKEDQQSKSIAYNLDIALNGVEIDAVCGRSMFRSVNSAKINNSTVKVTQLRGEDAVAENTNVEFVNSTVTAPEGTTLKTGTATVTTDAKTKYNGELMSTRGDVTLKEADKLPDAVDGVIKLTENVTLTKVIGNVNNPWSGNIDLSGYTLTLTKDAAVKVKNVSFKNGNLAIKDLTSGDGVFYLNLADTSLDFDNVKITVNDVNAATGIFSAKGANSKITLNNTDITASNISQSYLFYKGSSSDGGHVEINGGKITLTNNYTGTSDDEAEAYGKSAFFYVDTTLNNVTLDLDCSKPCFRFVENVDILNSTFNVNQMFSDHAVAQNSNLTFINSKFNTNSGATLTSGTGTIKSDANTTYNGGKLSEAAGVTALDSTVAVIGLGNGAKYYTTLKGAVEAIAAAKPTNTVTIECVAGADVGAMTHGHVASDLIINGHGAHLTYGSGEGDLEFDTYQGYLDRDVKVVVNDLNGIGAWGQRNTDYKITLVFNNCKNMSKVIFGVGKGPVDVTMNNCSFDRGVNASTPADTAVYIITKADVKINNTTFNNIAAPVNMANKSGAEQKLALDGCTFTSCATAENGVNANGYAAPVRMTTRGTSTTTATIKNCTFTDCGGAGNGQILLGDGRDDKESTSGVSVTVSGTAAEVQTQYPGEADKTAAETLTTADSKTITMKELTAVWETMTDSGKYDEGKGVIRFSFKVNPTKSFGAITKAGIKFVNTENTAIDEATTVGVEQNGADSVFYADITGITGSGKYFARAYISNGTSTEWSDMVEATVDWDRTFTDYTAE